MSQDPDQQVLMAHTTFFQSFLQLLRFTKSRLRPHRLFLKKYQTSPPSSRRVPASDIKGIIFKTSNFPLVHSRYSSRSTENRVAEDYRYLQTVSQVQAAIASPPRPIFCTETLAQLLISSTPSLNSLWSMWLMYVNWIRAFFSYCVTIQDEVSRGHFLGSIW